MTYQQPHTPAQAQSGLMMPVVVVMFGLCIMVLLAVFQYTLSVTNFGNAIVYNQVAQTAARGALEYGKEQFDGDANYTGTAETTMLQNSRYRVTFELKIDPAAAASGSRAKPAQGIGRIYIPHTATTPRYRVVLNGEIIRSQITAADPSDFSPLAWYDASCNVSTTTEPDGCPTDTVLFNGSANAAGNPNGFREEHSASVTGCSSGALDDTLLSLTRASECSNGQQLVGMTFNLGTQLPKGVTITDAALQMTSAEKDSAQIVVNVYGVLQGNTSPFAYSSGSPLSSLPRTAKRVHWDSGPWNSIGQSGVNQRVRLSSATDATNRPLGEVIQEIINQPSWTTGNTIGLVFEYASGPGKRVASKATPSITLNVSYSGDIPASPGQPVTIWKDRSYHGNHLTATSSGAPIRSTINQDPITSLPNGKPAVSFSASSAMRKLLPSNGRTSNAYTVFSVMKVKNGTNATGNGAIIMMKPPNNSGEKYAPFWRHPTSLHSGETSGFNNSLLCMARGTSTTTQERKNACLDAGIAATPNWAIWSAREALIERDILFRRSGTNFGGATEYNASPTLNAPYIISLNSEPVSPYPNAATPRGETDFSEVIIYDRALTCPQVESVEKYLAQKWGFEDTALGSFSKYQSQGCTENTIPVH